MGSTPRRTASLGSVLVVGGCGFVGFHVVDQLLNFPSEDTRTRNSLAESDGATKSGPSPPLSKTDPTTYIFPTLRSRYPSYKDTKVHVLDLRCAQNRLPGATYHEADITDANALLEVFRKVKPDVVINTASAMYDAPRHILKKVNIEGTKTLVDVAGGALGNWGGKCKAFVHTSSASVCHDTASDLIFADERWPYVNPNPREYYSETKAVSEIQVLATNNQPSHSYMLTCAIRPAGIVGEGDGKGVLHGTCTNAIHSADWQLHFQLGAGNNLFDTTYVGNVVLAHLLAASRLLETFRRNEAGKAAVLDHERVDGEAFFVTNDEPTYFWDFMHYAAAACGREIHLDKVLEMPKSLAYTMGLLSELSNKVTGRKARFNRQTVMYGCMTRTYSCEKAKRKLGYVPAVGLDEAWGRGVKEFLLKERETQAGAT